jgi:hypothetical protein
MNEAAMMSVMMEGIQTLVMGIDGFGCPGLSV